jgi:hypothetical protein
VNLSECITTISCDVQVPVSMLIVRLVSIDRVLKCHGKHFLLINVLDGPESNKTFSRVRDRTAEMVSTTMILRGVNCLLLDSSTFFSRPIFFTLSSSSTTGKAYCAASPSLLAVEETDSESV